MNTNQFTHKSREVIEKAGDIARMGRQQAIENLHLLKALLGTDENLMPLIFKRLEVNPELLNSQLLSALSALPKVDGGEPYFSQELTQTLRHALQLSQKRGDEYVSLDILFLALVDGRSAASQLLKNNGVTAKALDEVISGMRKGQKSDSESAEQKLESLSRFARNLNELAANGKLDPVIGRDDEIRRVLQILSRRTKNNPILVGEPGVGKTAIAEGLAQRIINGDVPENLKGKQLFSLDMGALIAGAMYKGEFEERLKSVVNEVVKSEGEIILFIDEIHTLVGAGKSEGAMDAANILKPALARGELRAIGATTLKEYQKYFENDKALERRFQLVLVAEPSAPDAVSILRGLKERYESHHQVMILDEAIVAAVDLSQRYISDRFLPDKAIDLIDEAAARLRLEINSLPEELEKIERRIRQLEIEKEAIKRENDQHKLNVISRELADLMEERIRIRSHWQAEKSLIESIQQSKKAIENLKTEADKAERDGNFGRVAEIRYGLMREEGESIRVAQEKLRALQGDHPMINEVVGSEEVAAIVSRWTGIPLNKMLTSEREKLLQLESRLHERVVSQDEAVQSVANAIRRSRAGLQDGKRPVGSFIFLGTTGVGKTELAKALAAFLFDSEQALIRIDMSEYQERHAVSRLIGAPPGYVGYEESGQLTEAVRRKPYAVILLDEIEKAHPDVFNILLQVLDDGRLTDNKGRTVDFKNTIIIMTSNIGSNLIQQQLGDGVDEPDNDLFEKTRSDVFRLLKSAMRPEFLNRVDEIVMFKPLSAAEIVKVVEIQVEELKQLLAKNHFELTLTSQAISFLAQKGYDPQYGARPVKRIIQRLLLDTLSRMILAGRLSRNSVVEVDTDGEKLIFSNTVIPVQT